MKFIRYLYYFFGSVYFALILIACVAAFVIAGTFLESYTQSHGYASLFTYENPIFALLLWGFFANIFLSAARRWPFKVRHIPFLITHFGLLMILAGALAKHYFGVQGNMRMMEGSGSHQIFELGSQAVLVENNKYASHCHPLDRDWRGIKEQSWQGLEGLRFQLIHYAPHCHEKMHSWFKGNQLQILGLNPMPIFEDSANQPLATSGKVRFQKEGEIWKIYAYRTEQLDELLKTLYAQDVKVLFSHRPLNETFEQIDLQRALQEEIHLRNFQGKPFKVTAKLNLSSNPFESIDSPFLSFTFTSMEDQTSQTIGILLNGPKALLNINETTPYLGNFPIAITLNKEPSLAFIEDENEIIHLICCHSGGNITWQSFSGDKVDSVIAYDNGFAGYAVRTNFSIPIQMTSRQIRETILKEKIKGELQLASENPEELSPPLHLLYKACNKANLDFTNSCVDLLEHLDSAGSWLYPMTSHLPVALETIINHIDWNEMNPHDLQASQWAIELFENLSLPNGKSVLQNLKKIGWPLTQSLAHYDKQLDLDEDAKAHALLTKLTQQIYAAAAHHPLNSQQPKSSVEAATYFSAYLRCYGICYSQALQGVEDRSAIIENEDSQVFLEASLLPRQVITKATTKLEENIPKLGLLVSLEDTKEVMHLAYDRQGTGLKWPMFQGRFVVRFQPHFIEIPYHVRLRNARQINYANSSQPYSFESDLVIMDRRNGEVVEKTISMNHVHETWDGYRFYLASISPPNENAAKHVQIIVNYDPAKYWLTYSGACILTLGIVLLFSMRPYRN